ncbi:ABC transporter ATP-binding protein [Marinifaba aquimaris]|uniref:ABC transporter ATP-binding protein n=1 Tax=Marinifaba aquimaris TaxID=2741323 RepID=UPI001FE8862D|nr:ABC transporter ATP-binding protein [Marinifaba aquimaris]
MPLLVDEVLLEKPASAVATMNQILPEAWHGPTAYILAILLVAIVMRLASMVMTVWQTRQFTIISKSISLTLRQRLINHLAKVQLKEFEDQGSAGISSRCITDIETLDEFISKSLSNILLGSLMIIGTAVILLWIDWLLGLIILTLNPAVIMFSRSFGKHVKKLKQKENASIEALQNALVETLDAIAQLKTARREQEYFKRVLGAASELKQASIQSHWKTDAVNRLSFTIFLLGFEVFRAIAMLMVVFSDLTVGQIFAVFGYLWFMLGPVQELLSVQYSYYGATAALKRLNQVIGFEQEPDFSKQNQALKNPFKQNQAVAIDFKQIHFAYQPDKPVLTNLSLTIEQGQHIAIVAASGGGKSTLVQLLLGLYQKQSGDILIQGIPIEQIGYQTIRENVATVMQHPMLFNDTVRENLQMGSEFSEQMLWQALAVAELADTIKALDKGLDTQVGRSGVKLSGGQKQRLAIARMVLTNPNVVILDEATSALDTETEAKVHANLKAFLQGKTIITVAHRLSAIKQANQIYVIEKGAVTQQGQHQALLSETGFYQVLYGT